MRNGYHMQGSQFDFSVPASRTPSPLPQDALPGGDGGRPSSTVISQRQHSQTRHTQSPVSATRCQNRARLSFPIQCLGSQCLKGPWGTPLCALCSRHPKNITLMEKRGRTGEETTLVSGTRSQGPARPGYAGGGIWKGDKGEETGRRAQIFRNQHGGLWGPLKDLFSAVAAPHLLLGYLCASP